MDLRAKLVEIMTEIGRPLEGDAPADRPLELESIEVVLVHDRLEEAFDIHIPAKQVTPEAFSTLAAIEALVRRIADGAT